MSYWEVIKNHLAYIEVFETDIYGHQTRRTLCDDFEMK